MLKSKIASSVHTKGSHIPGKCVTIRRLFNLQKQHVVVTGVAVRDVKISGKAHKSIYLIMKGELPFGVPGALASPTYVRHPVIPKVAPLHLSLLYSSTIDGETRCESSNAIGPIRPLREQSATTLECKGGSKPCPKRLSTSRTIASEENYRMAAAPNSLESCA